MGTPADIYATPAGGAAVFSLMAGDAAQDHISTVVDTIFTASFAPSTPSRGPRARSGQLLENQGVQPGPRGVAFEEGLAYIAILPSHLDPPCSWREFRVGCHFVCALCALRQRKFGKALQYAVNLNPHTASQRLILLK